METIVPYIVWPIAVVIIVCFFLIQFRKPISDFLFSLEKIGGYGLSLKKGISQEQRKEISQPKSKEELKKSIKREKNKEKFIFSEYTKLLKNYQFEQTFTIIFGTQIKVLEHLSKKGNLGDKYINLRIFYNEYLRRLREISSSAIMTMIDYLGYLKRREYIEYFGEGDELSIRITPLGDDFLSYIKKQYPGLYEIKLF